MPRWNFITATLGEGISTSTGTSRRVTHGIRTLCEVSEVQLKFGGLSLQDGHEHCEPQFLCADEGVRVGVPLPALDVV